MKPAARVSTEGRMFPCEIDYHALPSPDAPVHDAAVDAVAAWIRPATKAMRSSHPQRLGHRPHDRGPQDPPRTRNAALLPLHGELARATGRRRRPRADRRKVVVATNVAETSLTIDGIRLVVDSGLGPPPATTPAAASIALFVDPHLPRFRGSRRPAAPRPGTCIRLWSEAERAKRPGGGKRLWRRRRWRSRRAA